MKEQKLKFFKIIFFLLFFVSINELYCAQPKNNKQSISAIVSNTAIDKPQNEIIPIITNENQIKKPEKEIIIKQVEKPVTNNKSNSTEAVNNNKTNVKKDDTTIIKDEKKPQQKPEEPRFELNFENAALRNVLDYISERFGVTFLPDDAITDDKKIKGVNEVKITFNTNKPFTKNQIWDFLDLILEMSGLARIAMPGLPENFFRITQVATANKSNIPSFIGTDIDKLEDYQRVRYLYFVQNRQAAQIRDLITKLQSKNAQIEIFQDLNVLIMTDIAYNIKTLMKIVHELDSAGLPEVLSVIKLKNADAADVAKLYESLRGKEGIFIPFAEVVKKSRLTEATKVIAEPRTNAVIIFGPKESVIKLEEFIKTHIDKAIDTQSQKIHVYELNYAPAEQIANILNAATQFGSESEAAKFGAIRGGEKYLSKMYFEAEKQSNRLIIRGEPEDYKLIKKIIEELDQQQPQVAIEVFVLTIDFDRTRGLSSKIENPHNETLNYQTSSQVPGTFNGIQIDTRTGSLINNLVNLATGAARGTTVISLGKKSVWALLGILQNTTDAKVISNPFLVATNKYAATVSVGETHRINTDQVIGGSDVSTSAQGSSDANLSVTITPQINDFGIINLDINITIDQFVSDDPTSDDFANTINRSIHTNTNVADKEVLAIGGLVRNRSVITESNVPILSKIPLLGLFFKTKQTRLVKQNLLVFVAPRIIRPQKGNMGTYTKNKAEQVHSDLDYDDSFTNVRDPIHRWFFEEPNIERRNFIDNFLEPEEEIKEATKKTIKTIEKNKAKPKKIIKEKHIEKIVEGKPKTVNRRSLIDYVKK